MIALPDLDAALIVGRNLRMAAGDFLTALEFFDDDILGLTLKNIPDLKWPMDSRSPFYLLIELATTVDNLDLNSILERVLGQALETELISDAVLAQSDTQRANLWRIREELPEGTLREGLQLKHDISVPVSNFAAFFEDCAPKVHSILAGTRIWTFGHLGDGNIHYNLSPPLGDTNFGGNDANINLTIYRTAEQHGGSFAAEHGIGRSKPTIADQLRSPVERALMAQIHTAIDPDNIMNPGVVV